MITEQDLQAAIAECKGKRNPDSSTCIKLAAYYIVKEHLYPEAVEPVAETKVKGYSYAPAYNSGTEFSDVVTGMEYYSVLAIMDEAMSALAVLNPNFYASIIRKLENEKGGL